MGGFTLGTRRGSRHSAPAFLISPDAMAPRDASVGYHLSCLGDETRIVMAAMGDGTARTAFRIWECVLCGFRYDEAEGDPDGGVPAGTRWEDVPDDWNCPECSAAKSAFDMVVVG
jgi:rubredoxin